MPTCSETATTHLCWIDPTDSPEVFLKEITDVWKDLSPDMDAGWVFFLLHHSKMRGTAPYILVCFREAEGHKMWPHGVLEVQAGTVYKLIPIIFPPLVNESTVYTLLGSFRKQCAALLDCDVRLNGKELDDGLCECGHGFFAQFDVPCGGGLPPTCSILMQLLAS